MKVVTYNILYGAGIDRQFDKNLKAQGQFARYGRNRLPDLITLIKEWQPDILGLQEGAGWDRGDPSVIQQVATELKMNYFLARQQAGELSVMLLSKYKILDAQNLSAQIYPGGALRATLEGPDGLPLNVIVVHLDPNSADRRARQIDWLAEYLPAYLQQKTFLMGDFNQGFYFTRDGWEDGKLKDIGMELVAYAFVDNVLCNLGPEWQTTQWFQHYFPPSGISDHQPVGIEFVLYP